MNLAPPPTFEFGSFRLHTAKRLLMHEGEILQLTPKFFDILQALVECSGQVVSKERLIERLWPDSFVEEGNLTYNISVLRKALGERAGAHQYIVTVPGRCLAAGAITVFFKDAPVWDPIRSDPRFADLLRRMGITP